MYGELNPKPTLTFYKVTYYMVVLKFDRDIIICKVTKDE